MTSPLIFPVSFYSPSFFPGSCVSCRASFSPPSFLCLSLSLLFSLSASPWDDQSSPDRRSGREEIKKRHEMEEERIPLLTKFRCTCNRNRWVRGRCRRQQLPLRLPGIERGCYSLPESIACHSSCLALYFFLFCSRLPSTTSFPFFFSNRRPVSASE